MSVNTQPFAVVEFSGGVTDNYLDGEPNKYRFADNFVITDNRKLYTRPGSRLAIANDPQVPLGAQRVSALINLNNDYLFSQVGQRFFYVSDIDTDSYSTLQGPSGNDVYSVGDATTRASWGIWNNHLIVVNDDFAKPMKIYEDEFGQLQVRNAGLPGLASEPTITPGVGANSYLYAFIYTYTYKNKDTSFLDASPVTIVRVDSADAPDSTQIAISSIPVLTNGVGDNYDVANIEVEIYRTQANGDVLYFVDTIPNGNTTFNDNNSDATINTNPTLYTTDGTLDQQPAPICKYTHVTNNTAYYAHIQESATEVRPNRVFQSFISNPDSVADTFFVDVEDEIVGLSSYEFTPLVFCRSSVYRLDGRLSEDGSGSLTQQKINDTVGCISNLSIVRTRQGTFFAGTDGFYWTDAYSVKKISGNFDSRYLQFIQINKDRIYGVFDEENNRILWAVQNTGASAENDYIYCLDLRFGQPPTTFTNWKGNDDSDSFRPTSLAYYQQRLLRGDSRGYVFEHSPQFFTDLKVDILASPSSWTEEVIRYYYESTAFNFGTDFYRKWVPKIIVTADDETNLSLLIRSINDDGRLVQDLAPITFKNIIIWGDPDVTWGDPELLWNYQGLIQEQRRFAARGLRCAYKQIVLTNDFTLIDSSDESGQASVNNVAKTATLLQANAQFPSKAVDYFIAFSSDNYNKQYKITSVSTDTVVFEDVENAAPNGNYDWRIFGYPKDEILNLIGYTVHYAMLSQTQTPFISGGS